MPIVRHKKIKQIATIELEISGKILSLMGPEPKFRVGPEMKALGLSRPTPVEEEGQAYPVLYAYPVPSPEGLRFKTRITTPQGVVPRRLAFLPRYKL